MEKVKRVLSKKVLKLPLGNWLLLLLGLAVFCTLCLATITKSSIWFDEAFGAYLIKFNFLDIARYTSFDVHPPLFYWCLKSWSLIFGYSEIGLRSMSVFFGCIAIIFGYLLTRKLFNRKAANLSLLFMVISPMMVRYGQEMRMYTMMAAIALAATYVLTIAMNSKKKAPWVIYAVLVAAGMWTQYFMVTVWLAHWICRGVIVKYQHHKHFWKNFFSKEWVWTHVLVLALFMPWLPFAAKQVFVVQAYGFWIPSVTANTIPNFLTNVLYYLNSDQITGWMTAAFLVVSIGLLVLGGMIHRRQRDIEWRKSYVSMFIMAVVPVFTLILLSMPPLRSCFVERYLITSALFIAIFMGVVVAYGADIFKSKRWYIATILVVVLMGVGVSNVWRLGNYNKNTSDSNNTRQIIQAVDAASSTNNEPIISSGLYIFYEEAFYATPEHRVYFVEPSSYQGGSLEMIKDNNAHKIKDIGRFAKTHNKIWYVGWCKDNPDGFQAPYAGWTKIREITVKDSVDGSVSYKAIEYRTN